MYSKWTIFHYEKGTVLDELFGNIFCFQLANMSPSLSDGILAKIQSQVNVSLTRPFKLDLFIYNYGIKTYNFLLFLFFNAFF